MAKKQKTTKSVKSKPIKQNPKKNDAISALDALLAAFDKQSDEAIEDFLKEFVGRTMRDALAEFVGVLFEYVGFKFTEDAVQEDNLISNKAAYIDKMAHKSNLKPVRETKRHKAIRELVPRLMRASFHHEVKAGKKQKQSLFGQLTEWLIALSNSKARKARVETTKLMLDALRGLFGEAAIFEKAQFAPFVDLIGSKFLLHKLKDIDTGIKLDVMSFLTAAIEKHDQIFEINRGDANAKAPGPELMAQMVVKLNEQSYELRRQAAEFITKALSSAESEVQENMSRALLAHKNVLMTAVVEAGVREIEALLKVLQLAFGVDQMFDNSDREKLGLLMYHHNLKIAGLAAEFWARQFNVDKLEEGEYDEIQLNTYLVYLTTVANKRYDYLGVDEFIELGMRVRPFVNIASKAADVMDTLASYLLNNNVKVGKFTVLALLGIMIATAIEKKKAEEPFLEDALAKKIDRMLDAKQGDALLFEALIQLYRFQLTSEDTKEFKGRIIRLNSYMEDTKEFPIIKATYALFSQHRASSLIIQEQLNDNYRTYEKLFQQAIEDDSIRPTLKCLMYKIRLIIKEFLLKRDIYTDFLKVHDILERYKNETWIFDADNMIKSCLGIVYECFYADYLQLLSIREDLEGNLSRFRDRRAATIQTFERFTNFSTDKNKLATSQKVSVRLESFSLLVNTYMLVCKDKNMPYGFLYYEPNEQNFGRLRKYIEESLFNDKRYDQVLNTEHKQCIPTGYDESQNLNDVDEEMRKSITPHYIDEEIVESSRKVESDNDGNEETRRHNSQVYRFVCSKMVLLLKECSHAFEQALARPLMLVFFGADKSKTQYRPILHDYLKSLITRDSTAVGQNSFWTVYYHCIRSSDEPTDLISFSRFFAKIYLTAVYSKAMTKDQQQLLFHNFLNCTLAVDP